MATIETISNSVFDSILPVFGEPARRLPVWNEGQKMFIADEYESAAGHRYYKGIRFCENLAIVEMVGDYHSFSYIDGVEVYGFDGKERRLIGKRQYDKHFYNQDFIKQEAKEMVEQYIRSQMKIGSVNIADASVKAKAAEMVERSYTSLLDDNYLPRIRQMLPVLLPEP